MVGKAWPERPPVEDRGFARQGGAGRIKDAWLRSRAVRRLATLPKVRRLLDLAYGRPAFAFQTLNFRVGAQQHTHSDAIHFHSVPERFMCGVWTAFEDIAPGPGPLAYRPGSHKLPVLTEHGRALDNSSRALSSCCSAGRIPAEWCCH